MSGHKRRQYPQQQIAAYEPAPEVGGGYPAGAPPSDTGLFTPGAAPGMAPPTEQVGGMNLGPTPYAATPDPGYSAPYGAQTGYPSGVAGTYTTGYSGQYGGGAPTPAAAPAVPLNQLYNVDLLNSLPPPVNDLDLPPPPLSVPIEATVSQSEYSNATPEYMRSTLNVVPKTTGLMRKAKLPFSLVLRPFNNLKESDEPIPLQSDLAIKRCRRCRSYINPFVTLLDNNTRWRCSVCNLPNDIPQSFEYDAATSRPLNMFDRPEFNYGVVDFLAPQAYVSKPPQPPTYVFLLDTSVNSISIGALQEACRIITASLDSLPNIDGRSRVAFIGVDSSLTFFQIPPLDEEPYLDESKQEEVRDPRLLVVSDLDDPFLPSNSGLLLNLRDQRANIENLLVKIPEIYAGSSHSSNAMGSGLKAALKLISNVGGKIISINSSLPNTGVAKLEPRDEKKLSGTKNEYQLFQPGNSFYKSFAVECNRCQVSVDMFLICSSYQDVASLSNLPKFTGGNTYFYPGWNYTRPSDIAKLENELGSFLSQDFGQEGMLRVRASSGIRSSSFSGHFFVRSSDLMTFPNVAHDQTYVVNMQLEENITKPFIVVQSALLYTSAYGERKIRVMTMQVPVSDKLSDVYASADQQALAAVYSHYANERVISYGVASTQDYLNARIAELLKTYRTDVLNTHTASGAITLCTNLSLLPLLLFCLKKAVACRANTQILSDIRMHSLDLLITLPVPNLMKYLYPDFYALHELPDEAGLPDENGNIVLPARLNLSGQSMRSHGLYLLDDGQVMFLWISRDVVPQLLIDAFGTDDIQQIPVGKAELPVIESSDLNVRMRNIVQASRSRADTIYYPTLYILSEKSEPSLRMWATSFLVEDRSESEPTYVQYLNKIREKLTA